MQKLMKLDNKYLNFFIIIIIILVQRYLIA